MNKMNNNMDKKNSVRLFFSEIASGLVQVIKSKYLYIAAGVFMAGVGLNLLSQIYLHNSMSRGAMFPTLSDLILDRVPVIDVAILYDLFCIILYAIVFIYIVHRKEYGKIPYILLLGGIFYIIRALFVVLTPMGNPANFNGSDPLFNGFMKYELGVYPSGHVGNSFLLLLIVSDKIYRYLMFACLLVIIAALIMTHCHYSIDILSGFIFSYAIKSFGDRNLSMFSLKE